MELPIDHFRLLGVSPTTDDQSVLRTLQQRLDRAPDQGFTHETLEARADLLRASADLLTDEARRRVYESQLTSLGGDDAQAMAALEVASSHEVGGLLLLFEAGQPLEVFEQAERCLQPPRAPSLGSGREADLTLLAGLSSQAAAAEYAHQRRYEAASQTLARGLQLLQRMGQCAALRDQIALERDQLLPYRILDLLSRDLAAVTQRSEGLDLLEQMVQQRGGIDSDASSPLSPQEFQAFLAQIRSFLTLQEQLDLFERWSRGGSVRAEVLACKALTASGFAQRKPERIAAALERLTARSDPPHQPDQACLLLLLGDVDQAETLFSGMASQNPRHPVAGEAEDPLLVRLCAVCRDWLAREVLTGYRDLDTEPDLDAYFNDRDVQSFVERQDRRRRRAEAEQPRPAIDPVTATSPAAVFPPASPTGTIPAKAAVPPPGAGRPTAMPAAAAGSLFTDAAPLPPLAESMAPGWDLTRDPHHPFPEELSRASLSPQAGPDREAEDPDQQEVPLWTWSDLHPAQLRANLWDPAASWVSTELAALPRPLLWGGALAVGGVLLASGWWLWRPRVADLGRQAPPVAAPQTAPAPGATTAPTAAPPQPQTQPPATKPPRPQSLPLEAVEPNEAQLRTLLEGWLEAKAAVLAGDKPAVALEEVARSNQAAAVEGERRRDQARERRQMIDTKVLDLRIAEQSPRRVVLVAELRYSDQTLAADGAVIETTAPFTLTNTYVFARDSGPWQLVSFHRGG
ncbi:IMS domain-containing protein [Synechococcus sp. CS-1328]|uniref:IMS domain-containing protein n=1 Tax=Synechococcus sp. CS-1328 TaxID=2847976 RepID=UPI00223BA76F|nr:IMS domain-containing protein [Synechococcus sp. CS-1328]MCT0223809.1 DUF4101 domain-containing protein [Synechococcus sp. CS-1328]